MHRVWIADWYHDRKNAGQSLMEALETALQAPPPTPPPAVKEDDAPVSDDHTSPPLPVSPGSQYKEAYEIWNAVCEYPQEYFYEPRALPVIRAQIMEIIRLEAPIYEKLLSRRVSRYWGFSRTGENIQRIITQCLPDSHTVTRISGEPVYWSAERIPASYRNYRIANDSAFRRNIDEIPPEELANAMYEILIDFQSCEQDTLFRETVRIFGFTSMSVRMKPHLELSLNHLRQCGRI